MNLEWVLDILGHMTFWDISTMFAEVRHWFQWAGKNLHRNRLPENEFIPEADVQAKFQIILYLISIAFFQVRGAITLYTTQLIVIKTSILRILFMKLILTTEKLYFGYFNGKIVPWFMLICRIQECLFLPQSTSLAAH